MEAKFEARFEVVNHRLDAMDERFERVESELKTLRQRTAA